MFRMEIKEITSEGTFEGLLSPYGNVDHGGDVVEPGAYKKTLAERGNTVPLLWQHKTDLPIGILVLEDRPEGLYCKGKLELGLQKAQEAHLCLKNKIIKGLSIGFETVKDSIENGVRHLKEIRLYEGSVVTFPMNELAMVTAIKARAGIKGDFNEELEEIQTLSAFWQMQSALGNALYSLVWAEMTKDEKTTMCNSILEQFSEAFSTFFPKYLDALETTYGPSEAWSSDRKPEIKGFSAEYSITAQELLALFGFKAGQATLQQKAAEQSSEPETHSAADDLNEAVKAMEGFRALIPA